MTYQKISIEKLATLIKDGTHGTHKNVEIGPYLLSAQNIENGNIYINENDRKISNEDFDSIHRNYKLQNDDILVTIVGSLGRCAILKNYNRNFTFQRSVAIMRFDNTKIIPKYAYYQIQTSAFQKELSKRESKGAQGGVYLGELATIQMLVPNLETQQKIVQILETWDNSINELELLIRNEKAKQKWLIHRLICDNKNAKIEKLCNLAKITTGKKDVNQGSSNGKYPFFTCAKEHTWSDDYSFNGEAICIAGNGEIGKSFYYNGKFEAYQRTYVLTNFTVSGQYLDYVIKSLFKEMVEHQKQMSAMPYIKLETLRNFVVPIPSNQEIYKIVKILSDEEMIINYYEKILDKTKSQKQYLLNHLISGDFDLTNIKLENGKEQQ